MPQKIQDVRVSRITPLIAPDALLRELPLTGMAGRAVLEGRDAVKAILEGRDGRLLAIVGPCSIHDERAALEYARRLDALRRDLSGVLCIVMRVYFEKPRTTIGWKGLIADPRLDGSGDMPEGLRRARRLLLSIASLGLPAATEMLDPIVPQYTADLVSWAAVGARTTESQTHREMASGLSMPVGFKNSTAGSLQVALDAMESSRHPHSFLGIDPRGRTAVVKTKGNPWVHLILRGGISGPNYFPRHIQSAADKLSAAGLRPTVLVDCSHANSGKKHEQQEAVLKSVLRQRRQGQKAIIGFMLESSLLAGCQPIPRNPRRLKYGISITDSCMGWEKTEALLRLAARP
ncbi:MAG: 3-deoxy-7-phosphoheptulonate synthase [Fibrobacterota bacterium]